MSIYQVSKAGTKCRLTEYFKLWDALELDKETMRIISITGAGGKTSVMFRLAAHIRGALH